MSRRICAGMVCCGLLAVVATVIWWTVPAARAEEPRDSDWRPKPQRNESLRRMHHLQEAAENLETAGFLDEARHVRGLVREIEVSLEKEAAGSPALIHELRELRGSLTQLRNELAALRREIQRDGPGPEPTMAPGVPPRAVHGWSVPGLDEPREEAPSVPVPYFPSEPVPSTTSRPSRETEPTPAVSAKTPSIELEYELVPIPFPKQEAAVPTPVDAPQP